MYTPKPIDTSEIELSAEIKELCELLSKTHMRYGLQAESVTVGPTVKPVMT